MFQEGRLIIYTGNKFKDHQDPRGRTQDEPYIEFILTTMSKRIETTFSEIAKFLPKKVHAVIEYGFLLKVVMFIFEYAISRTVI